MAEYRPYGYQYETSPRKVETEFATYKKKKSTLTKNSNEKKLTTKKTKKAVKSNKKAKYNAKPIIYIMAGFVMLFTIGYRNSIINENYNKKEQLKSQLSAVEKENEQLKVNIESSLNLNNVEKMAEEKLGMQKLTNNQKVYVNLQKKDYIEPTTEKVVIDQNTSWWSKILDSLTEVIK